MQCRYCSRPPVTGSPTCTNCNALINAEDWEQLAQLWLFWYPEDWEPDVAAFLELTVGLGADPPRVVAGTALPLNMAS